MRSILAFPLLFLLVPLAAQEETEVFLSMNSQILLGEEIVWDQNSQLPMAEGVPIHVQFQGNNLKMVVRVTYATMEDGLMMLVVQSETLLTDEEGTVNFYSNLKSIQLPQNERVIYYPLGNLTQNNSDEEPVLRLILLLGDGDEDIHSGETL